MFAFFSICPKVSFKLKASMRQSEKLINFQTIYLKASSELSGIIHNIEVKLRERFLKNGIK